MSSSLGDSSAGAGPWAPIKLEQSRRVSAGYSLREDLLWSVQSILPSRLRDCLRCLECQNGVAVAHVTASSCAEAHISAESLQQGLPRMCAKFFSCKMFGPFQGRSSVVEQRPFKPKVVGSIPTAPTNISFFCLVRSSC